MLIAVNAAAAATGPAATAPPAAVATAPAATAVPAAPGTAAPVGKLTLDQCVEIAIRRSPAITAADSSVNAASARVGQARSAYYPQVGLTGSLTRASTYLDPTNSSQDLYQGNAHLNQLLSTSARRPARCGSSA